MNWLIIGGAARSGTSAFLKALNSKQEIFLIPEYFWSSQIKSLDESIFKKYNSSISKINIGKVNNQERPGAESLLIKDFIKYIPSQDSGCRAVVEAIASSTSGKANLKFIGEKLPEYWRYTDFKRLSKVFNKKVKLVHIARSPLHVIASFQHRIQLSQQGKDRFRFDTFQKAVEHINESYRAYCLATKSKYIDIHFIKYEELFEDGDSLNSLGNFLGINTEGISEYFKGDKYGSIENLELDRAQLRKVPPKLLHLSSMWNSNSHSLISEIKRLWIEGENTPGQITSKISWHYGLAKKLDINKNNPEKPAQKSAPNTLDYKLFLHEESLENSHLMASDEIMVAEKDFYSSINNNLGEYSRLDGSQSRSNKSIEFSRATSDEVEKNLRYYFNLLAKLRILDTTESISYQQNFIRNYSDLLLLREYIEQGWLDQDKLYSEGGNGFYTQKIDTSILNTILKDQIETLRNSEPASDGLDRSILFSFNQKNSFIGNNLMTELSKLCFGALLINDKIKSTPVRYKLRSATLHCSEYSDTHNYMTRLDEFPKPRLLNMHIDPLFTTRKVIIYLDETGIENGPFSYIPKSNKYELMTPYLLQIKAFGKASYWPTQKIRNRLKYSPKNLGLTNVFGSTCSNPKKELWSSLASKEILFTGNDNSIVFSPCGMHRGGIVGFGKSRIALQVILDLCKS